MHGDRDGGDDQETSMKIAIARERIEGETRVAATPETVGKLVALGATVAIEKGAGTAARFPDADYEAAGASVVAGAALLKGADIVLTVRRPAASALAGAGKGVLVIGIMDPYGNEDDIAALAKTGATAIAMEFMPRITRAQVMDGNKTGLQGHNGFKPHGSTSTMGKRGSAVEHQTRAHPIKMGVRINHHSRRISHAAQQSWCCYSFKSL